MRALARHVRGHLVAYVALIAAMSGSAWAAGTGPIGSLKLTLGNYQSLQLTQDVSAAQTSAPVTVSADGAWHTILQTTQLNSSLSPALTLFNATISAENQGAKASMLGMRMLVDGQPEPGVYSATVAPGTTGNLAGLLKCDGMPVGAHKVELQVLANGGDLVIDTAADEGLRPIVIPPCIPAAAS